MEEHAKRRHAAWLAQRAKEAVQESTRPKLVQDGKPLSEKHSDAKPPSGGQLYHKHRRADGVLPRGGEVSRDGEVSGDGEGNLRQMNVTEQSTDRCYSSKERAWSALIGLALFTFNELLIVCSTVIQLARYVGGGPGGIKVGETLDGVAEQEVRQRIKMTPKKKGARMVVGSESNEGSQERGQMRDGASLACCAESGGVESVCFELPTFGRVDDLSFTLISWNLDGISEEGLTGRTLYFIDQVRSRKPAVCLLQEVVDLSHEMIKRYLSGPYHVVAPPVPPLGAGTPKAHGYYNVILLSKYHWDLVGGPVALFYPQTQMGRHLLYQRVTAKGLTRGEDQYTFGSTHLESLKPSATERISQHKQVFNFMSNELARYSRTEDCMNSDKSCSVIVGGDFNARDTEVKRVLGSLAAAAAAAPPLDVWQLLGSRDETRYTWDMRRNDNLGHCNKAALRFDRVYIQNGKKAACFPNQMALIGTQRIGDIGLPGGKSLFCSDHWGIAINFQCNVNGDHSIENHNHLLGRSDQLRQ